MFRYNAKECSITVDDVFITGVGEDMASGEKDEENFSTAVGAQGDVCMNEVNNPLGTVTITVNPCSPSAKYLRDLANAGKVVSVWVSNKSKGTRYGGTQARIKKTPSEEDGAEAADLEFEFQVFDYVDEGA